MGSSAPAVQRPIRLFGNPVRGGCRPDGEADRLAAARMVDKSARRLENYLRVCTEELKDFARLTGNDDVHHLSVADLCTTNSEVSDHTDIAHV